MEFGCQLGILVLKFSVIIRITAVSYTHLDVYKRQDIACTSKYDKVRLMKTTNTNNITKKGCRVSVPMSNLWCPLSIVSLTEMLPCVALPGG